MSNTIEGQICANSLNLLRFPLAIVVVLVHVFSVAPSSFNISNITDSTSLVVLTRFINVFLLGIPVPVYFFMSGFFFFSGSSFTTDIYKNKLRKRFYSLFIPYIIWNTAAILGIVLKNLPVFSSLLSFPGTSVDWDIKNVLSCFWEYNGRLSPPPVGVENYVQYVAVTPYPINTALWYVRDLMTIVLFSPLIRLCILRLRECFIIVVALIYLVGSVIPIPAHPYQLIIGIFFFSWGAYFSLNTINIHNAFAQRKYVILLLWLINSSICFYLNDNFHVILNILTSLNSILVVVVSFNLASTIIIKYHIIPKLDLVPLGYFIYLSHCIFSARITKLMIKILLPTTDYEITIVYVLSFIIVLLFLYFVYNFMRRFMPRILRITIGGK